MKPHLISRVVCVDVETTGLSPHRGHRVIEIGAVAIENQKIVDQFNSLIRPGRSISLSAQSVHGITELMLAGQPGPESVFPRFHEFISGSILAAHNAHFDMGFLRVEFARLGLPFDHPVVCTLEQSREHCRPLKNYQLATVARHLGVAPRSGRNHRALEDAHLVAGIWLALNQVRKRVLG